MKKDDLVYINHILKAINRIEEYIQNVSHDEFINNNLLQDGIIRQIQIIGEASKKVTGEFKKKNNEIPWRDISGMRDKLIHDYFGVDVDAVWYTATSDIVLLKNMILKII